MNAAGNPYFTCHSSNTLFEQLPRRGLLDSSPNIKTRHAYYARPGPQHRICKTQSRAIVRQPYQSSRAPTTPTGSMSTEELEITKDAEFRQVWSKALTCQRYRNYRSKKRGCKTGDGEGCRAKDFAWPDEYEFAFWRASVMWGPRDRRTVASEIEEKELGRNESIAQYLESKFGGKAMWGVKTDGTPKLGRKVVSSHVQVVRGQLQLPKDELAMNPPPVNPFADLLDYFPKQGKEDKNKDKSTEGTVGLRLTIPDQIRTKKPKQSRIPNHNFKVHDFQMYIRLLNEDNQRIHEITGLSSELEPSCVSVEDVHDQIREFPELQDLLYGGDIRCPVVLVEATFDLPSQECLVAGKELCIAQCVKTSRELKSGYVWKTRTSIFAPGAKVLAGEESMESFNANKTVHEIKFRSAYWADLFTHYGSQLHTKPDAPRKSGVSADKHRQVRDHLRGIRAVQEILSHPKTGNGSGTPERHMMICWTFKQAHPGEAGVTKWQEIVIPPTLPSQSHIYPSPSASFTPDEGTEDGYNMSFDLYNNMPYIEGMHHHQAGDPTDSDAWRSPERLTAMPYFGANIWPPIVPSQALIPRSYDIPSYNASQHPVVQELYDEPDYLAVGFGMTPPNSALVASFAQSFDTSAASDESQSPPEPSDESQAAQYSQGTGYSQASSGQYAEHVDDSLGGQTMHVYVPQAQYADLPLNTSFMYDQQLQDFSSFSRVLEDDHTVGGLEYHFDQSTVPILASQPVHVDDGGDNVNRRGSLSHLRLTAAFDPSFFSPIIPEAPQILPLSSGVTHATVMPHLLPRALEHGEE